MYILNYIKLHENLLISCKWALILNEALKYVDLKRRSNDIFSREVRVYMARRDAYI